MLQMGFLVFFIRRLLFLYPRLLVVVWIMNVKLGGRIRARSRKHKLNFGMELFIHSFYQFRKKFLINFYKE